MNLILVTGERDSSFTGPQIAFLHWECSLELNPSSLDNCLRGMLEGIDYHAVGIVMPIVRGFVNCVTG